MSRGSRYAQIALQRHTADGSDADANAAFAVHDTKSFKE